MIKVIAFDLDDTLWDVKPVLLRAERILDEFLSSNFPMLQYDVVSMRELRHEVLADHPDLIKRITEFRRHIIERAMIKSGILAEEAESFSLDAIQVFLKARHEIEFFDDVIPVLEKLSTEFVLGVLTNGNADIRRLGLQKYFKFSYAAEEIGAPKPATDLFHIALKHTRTSPGEMVYVGDDLLHDVTSANQVGINSIWVNRKRKEEPDKEDVGSHPDETIYNIEELPNAVQKLNQRLTRS